MSWSEIKKAINSNLAKPLNTLIAEKHTDLANKFGWQYVSSYTVSSDYEQYESLGRTYYGSKTGVCTVSNAPCGIAIFSVYRDYVPTGAVTGSSFAGYVNRNNITIARCMPVPLKTGTSGEFAYPSGVMIIPLTHGDTYTFNVNGAGSGVSYSDVHTLQGLVTIFSLGGGIS